MQSDSVLPVVRLLMVAFRIQGAMLNAPASWSAVVLHRFSLAPQNRPPFQITLTLRPTFNAQPPGRQAIPILLPSDLRPHHLVEPKAIPR